MTVSTEVTLGVLALKGNRFDEAVERFTDLVARDASPTAWLGLACAKLGTLLTGETSIDEVVTCFNVARRRCEEEDDRRFVEEIAARRGIATICMLHERRNQLVATADHVQARAGLAALTAGLSILTGTRSSSRFGAFASYDIFSRSVDALSDRWDEDQDIESAVRFLDRKVAEVSRFVRTFSESPSDEYLAALRLLDEIDAPRAGHSRLTAQHRVQPDPGAEWLIQIPGDRIYSAADREMLSQWIAEGRVPPTAAVWHPTLKEWTKVERLAAGVLPKRSAPLNEQATRSTRQGTALGCAAVAICVGGIAFGIVMFFELAVTTAFWSTGTSCNTNNRACELLDAPNGRSATQDEGGEQG